MNATDLLHKTLDFVCIWQSDVNKYKANVLAGNDSSYYRILQIEALLSALKITPKYADPKRIQKNESGKRIHRPEMTNLEYFLNRSFLEERNNKICNQDLFDEIVATVREILPIHSEPSDYYPGIYLITGKDYIHLQRPKNYSIMVVKLVRSIISICKMI